MTKPAYDKRRHHRYDVRGVRANLTLPLDVAVLDMSLTGLRIESPVPLAVGSRYHLTLRREHEVIQLDTELQWCRQTRTEPDARGEEMPIFEVGLDFQSSLSRQARELLGFLQHNVVIELDRRHAFGFMHLFDEEPTSASHQDFEVRQLSFSGMLIRTQPMPKVDADYHVEVHLDRLELRTRGRVIHAERVETEDGDSLCEAGIAFPELEPDSQIALEEMVAHSLE